MTDTERLAALNKALGHPARVAIVEILAEERQCLSGDLSDRLPLAASTVSQHLKILSAAGVIRGTVDGPRRCYCLDPAVMKEWSQRVAALVGQEAPLRCGGGE